MQRDNASIIVPTCRLSCLCQKRGKPEEAESNVISAVALKIPVSILENTYRTQTIRGRILWKPAISLTDTDNSPGAPTDHRMWIRPSHLSRNLFGLQRLIDYWKIKPTNLESLNLHTGNPMLSVCWRKLSPSDAEDGKIQTVGAHRRKTQLRIFWSYTTVMKPSFWEVTSESDRRCYWLTTWTLFLV